MFLKEMEALMAAITVMAMIFSSASAANIEVGGSTAWDLSTNFTLWSASNPIFVNDSLSFRYTPEHDVIEVSEVNFFNCDTSSPIGAYNDKDGKTVINVTQPGTRYFVCGRSNHCDLGLKLRATVLDSPQIQPNISTPTYPANQTDIHTIPSDSPNNEHALNSSAGQRNAIIWEHARLVLTIYLFAATFIADFVALFGLMVRMVIRIIMLVWSVTAGFTRD
ncbi:hypothetical protein RND81_04G044300 [Saponaria officinalis]|uniref:Phytocyanin domain-containing protein n=1 Tax=Saponaria officinalis TaxID=3572 RepID=A0AAW1LCS8_SAPOF